MSEDESEEALALDNERSRILLAAIPIDLQWAVAELMAASNRAGRVEGRRQGERAAVLLA